MGYGMGYGMGQLVRAHGLEYGHHLYGLANVWTLCQGLEPLVMVWFYGVKVSTAYVVTAYVS